MHAVAYTKPLPAEDPQSLIDIGIQLLLLLFHALQLVVLYFKITNQTLHVSLQLIEALHQINQTLVVIAGFEPTDTILQIPDFGTLRYRIDYWRRCRMSYRGSQQTRKYKRHTKRRFIACLCVA